MAADFVTINLGSSGDKNKPRRRRQSSGFIGQEVKSNLKRALTTGHQRQRENHHHHQHSSNSVISDDNSIIRPKVTTNIASILPHIPEFLEKHSTPSSPIGSTVTSLNHDSNNKLPVSGITPKVYNRILQIREKQLALRFHEMYFRGFYAFKINAIMSNMKNRSQTTSDASDSSETLEAPVITESSTHQMKYLSLFSENETLREHYIDFKNEIHIKTESQRKNGIAIVIRMFLRSQIKDLLRKSFDLWNNNINNINNNNNINKQLLILNIDKKYIESEKNTYQKIEFERNDYIKRYLFVSLFQKWKYQTLQLKLTDEHTNNIQQQTIIYNELRSLKLYVKKCRLQEILLLKIAKERGDEVMLKLLSLTEQINPTLNIGTNNVINEK